MQSAWHHDIVNKARQGFRDEVGSQAVCEYFEVPGAFELPLHVRTLAETGRFDAVIAAGGVVDGGIYRHEFVADAVINGLMRVQLDLPLHSRRPLGGGHMTHIAVIDATFSRVDMGAVAGLNA